jgi:flagellar hook-associated protein 1 FlgK
MAGLLEIATSGLAAFQRSLSTVGHNISNVNTEGYSRQRVELGERNPSFTGAGYVGNGVNAVSVRRAYDSFLDNQVRLSTSAHAELDTFHTMSAQVDTLFADPDAGLDPALQSFFNAVQDVAADPTSIAAREVMLSEGDALTHRFNLLDTHLNELRDRVNQGLSDSAAEINSLTSNIAALNQEISVALGRTDGLQLPNDLLDQRGLLTEKLAKLVDTRTVEQSDGMLNVFVGNGQALVAGAAAAKLQAQNSQYDPQQKDIAVLFGNANVVVTNQLSGGKIGGLLDFGARVLDPAQNALGRIAAGVSLQFNARHELGADLDGVQGTPFFVEPTVANAISIFPKTGSTGTVTVDYVDINQLQLSDYRLDYDGAATYTLTRLSDKAVVASNATGDFTGVNGVDGLDISLVGAAGAGSFLIRPTRAAAGQIGLSLTDPVRIAAAGYPASGPGDNSNALSLAQLQNARGLLNGKANYQEALGVLVGDVGGLTHAAEINGGAQQKLLEHAQEARDAVSGVNLDEEAANLIKFQQSYQAAAQLIDAVNTTFDALIGAIRS